MSVLRRRLASGAKKPELYSITLSSSLNRTGRVLYQDGKIWIFTDTPNFIPTRTTEHASIDINTHNLSVFSFVADDELLGWSKFHAVAAPNGFFYLPPVSGADIMKISVSYPSIIYTFIHTTIPSSTLPKYSGGVLLQNGQIYWGIAGVANAGGLWVDTTNDTYVSMGTFSSLANMRTSILGRDGNIYSSTRQLATLEQTSTSTKNNVTAVYGTGDTLFVGSALYYAIMNMKIYNYGTSTEYVKSIVKYNYAKYICVPPGDLVYALDASSRTLTIFTIQYNGTIVTKDTIPFPSDWNFPNGLMYCSYAPNGLIYIRNDADPSSDLYIIDTHTYVDAGDAVIPSNLATLATSNYNLYFNK